MKGKYRHFCIYYCRFLRASFPV